MAEPGADGRVLHDIGRLILASAEPESYVAALHRVRSERVLVTDAERHVFGATHAEIGAYLLGLWGVPAPIVEAVAWHHNPPPVESPGARFSPVTAVHAAAALLCPDDGGGPNVDYLARLGLADRLPARTDPDRRVEPGGCPVTEKILFVDDEPNVLAGLMRQLRASHAVDTAPGGAEGLAALDTRGPFAVVVSDMRMPGMDGATFLAHARERHPDAVRILLTGYADVRSAIEAVNRGGLFPNR